MCKSQQTVTLLLPSMVTLCQDCAVKLTDGISKESRKVIESIQKKHIEEKDIKHYIIGENFDYETPIDEITCKFNARNIEEVEEFKISSVVQNTGGFKLVVPMMASLEAIKDIQELLSQETKDYFNRMKDDLISVPPSYKSLFDNKPE